MPGFIDISLIGDKVLQRKLKRLPIATQKKIVRKALREGGRPVLAAAQQNVPVRSGRTKASLKLRARKAKRGSFGVDVRTGTRAELGIPENDPSYYPFSVEYGHGNVAAQPFMRPAMDDNRDKALRIIGKELGAGILREARKR